MKVAKMVPSLLLAAVCALPTFTLGLTLGEQMSPTLAPRVLESAPISAPRKRVVSTPRRVSGTFGQPYREVKVAAASGNRAQVHQEVISVPNLEGTRRVLVTIRVEPPTEVLR